MKVPIVLVLISALIATPLFADTITLKNGQTYTGEIVEVVKEYVKFKTESGVLGIPISDIATIDGSKPEARLSLIKDAIANAETAAEAGANKTVWLGVGFFTSCIGVALASFIEPSPPRSYLIGKSPEYVVAFTRAYKKKAKGIQTRNAMIGCAASGVACGATALLLHAAWWKAYEEGYP